jgi:hypothetical protein
MISYMTLRKSVGWLGIYAIAHHEKIDSLCKSISRQYFVDLLELTNLKKFKRSRINEFKKLIALDERKYEALKIGIKKAPSCITK